MGKIVEQSDFFNLGMATSLVEGKPAILHFKKIDLVSHSAHGEEVR